MLYILNILNSITYVIVKLLNISPIYTITSGSIQKRAINHFIFTAPEELDRFTSFFGEPSTFIFLIAISSFVFLHYNQSKKAIINFLIAFICFSGSVPYLIFIFLTYLIVNTKSNSLKVTVFEQAATD